MPCARVKRPLAASTSADPPPAHPAPSENYGERTRRILNKRAAAAASTNGTTMAVVGRPADTEPPPHPDTFLDAAFYIKLKATLKVILVSGWGVFMQQYHFNELGDIMSELEKGQNFTKYAEETAVDLDCEMLMDAKLIGNFITQKVAAEMAKKKNSMKIKLKDWRTVEKMECRESRKKTVRGVVDAPPVMPSG